MILDQFLEGDQLVTYLKMTNPNFSLKQYNSLTEEAKEKVNDKAVTRLFNQIKNKAATLDFSDFNISKGDITKINNYKLVNEAISYFEKFLNNHNDNVLRNHLNDIKEAINHLKTDKILYQKAFEQRNNLGIYLYDSACLSIVQGTSCLIAYSVEYVTGNNGMQEAKLNSDGKKLKCAYLDSVNYFNKCNRKGTIRKTLSKLDPTKKEEGILFMLGSIVGGIAAVLVLIKLVIYVYYSTRVTLSAYFAYMSAFVEMNALTLGQDKAKVKEKQLDSAKKLRDMSERLKVDVNMASEKAEREMINDERNADDDGII